MDQRFLEITISRRKVAFCMKEELILSGEGIPKIQEKAEELPFPPRCHLRYSGNLRQCNHHLYVLLLASKLDAS